MSENALSAYTPYRFDDTRLARVVAKSRAITETRSVSEWQATEIFQFTL